MNPIGNETEIQHADLSINDKLLIQMRSSSGRKSAVRIPLTLVDEKRKRKLEQIFNKIIQNNGCQTS